MKKALNLFFVFLSFAVLGQKDDKIEYYTDSDVHRPILSFSLRYDPYYSTRNLLDQIEGTNEQTYFFLNNDITGQFGQAYGLDIYLNLNRRLKLGFGVGQSHAGYSWDFVKLLDDAGNVDKDTIPGDFRIDVSTRHINIPIKAMFTSRMNDLWALDVVPEFNFDLMQNLEYTLVDTENLITPEKEDSLMFGDQTENAVRVNYTFGLNIGGRYFITEKISLHLYAMLRYSLNPLTESYALRESLFRYGGSFGITYAL